MDKEIFDRADIKALKKSKAYAYLSKVERRLPFEINFMKPKYHKEILSIEQGRKILKDAINKGDPFLAGRFGTSEGAAFFKYIEIQAGLEKSFSKNNCKYMCCNAGFFPQKEEMLLKWGELLKSGCDKIDLLGKMGFIGEEWIAENLCHDAEILPANGLASANRGWTDVLENHKVLVIHPFEESIRYQYNNHRTEIFPGTNMLPEFDLKTVKAVQTIADSTDKRFATWFDALDYMTEEAQKHDFDVALIGCGAYGLPLGMRIKDMGKVAVHMGGCLQTLFGIKGQRWEKNLSTKDIINPSWIYPNENERPAGLEKVEGGCYW